MSKNLFCFALCTMLFALCSPATAQPTARLPRVGVLVTGPIFFTRFKAFQEGFRDLGYVEGKNFVYEYRNADGNLDRLPDRAAELVRSKVDVIFTASGEGVLAATKATTTIPIVFGSVQDPLASGLVESLARPGGNVTGLSAVAPDLGGKRLELLKETAPRVRRVAFFWSPLSPGASAHMKETQSASQALGLQLQPWPIREFKNLEGAFDAALKERTHALSTAPDPVINNARVQFVGFATKNRLPAMYAAPEFAEADGLMSYAPNYGDMWRRAATMVDKILKGTKPADIPVEQPTKFEFVINLKAAKQIGLTMPPNVLARADKVIK
jgi:putative tryptophan/tyrosine transport system substrate-binding protein